jgi:hypothetical protein
MVVHMLRADLTRVIYSSSVILVLLFAISDRTSHAAPAGIKQGRGSNMESATERISSKIPEL